MQKQENTAYEEDEQSFYRNLIPYPKDLLITFLILGAATLVGLVFYNAGLTESNIITVYILGVLLTALFTRGYACGLIASLMSVMLFNFFFTEPRFGFHAYDPGYAITFAIMLTAAIITGTLASKLKDQAKLSAQTAYRTKVLFDTNQLLQKATNDEDILNITATQLAKLLNRSVVIYSVKEDGDLSQGVLFSAAQGESDEAMFGDRETAAAEWVCHNRRRAGAMTDIMGDAKCQYIAIQINDMVYGVVGIHVSSKPLDALESSVLKSILGESALAMDNSRNAKEKQQAAVLAKNEQLRANLLRSISHDLRTPLTSISGNASNLLSNYEKLDKESREQAFQDISDDAQWLISLVENLLSVTRINEGQMNINMSVYLMDEVIDEAMKHLDRKSEEHIVTTEYKDELLLARMDAKLIIQVIINLVDNAIKYTPPGSEIHITAQKRDGFVAVSVADNGAGIPDSYKPRVFDMFFTGDNAIADSRRSLGLGLPLCRSIISAHGGEITLTDNVPQGCVFTFTVPSGEVEIEE